MKKAVILGATGLIGSHLLKRLLQDDNYEQVTIFVRQSMDSHHTKLKQIVIDDFTAMTDFSDSFRVDDVFCCLGTTIKKAKTKEKFRQVDYSFPLLAAELAKVQGVTRYLLVSAMGANDRSSIFYNQVKGEIEKAIQQIQLPSFYIFRPSLLLGEREEFRLGEKLSSWISQPLSFLFTGSMKKYKPIRADDVALVMHRMGQTFLPGTHVFENDQIHNMCEK